MDEETKRQHEAMRDLGYEFSQAGAAQSWIKRNSGAYIHRPDRQISRWYACYGVKGTGKRARQEFTNPVAAAVWLQVELS